MHKTSLGQNSSFEIAHESIRMTSCWQLLNAWVLPLGSHHAHVLWNDVTTLSKCNDMALGIFILRLWRKCAASTRVCLGSAMDESSSRRIHKCVMTHVSERQTTTLVTIVALKESGYMSFHVYASR